MLEIIQKRRSIRQYKDTKIDKEMIEKLIKAALWAPTSRNSQPWEFIVVDDKTKLEQLSRSKKGSQCLWGAALGIIVLADPAKSDVWVEDTAVASAFLLLAAESLGLGSCWIQIRERIHDDQKTAEQYVKEILSIPDNLKVESIISLGYADEIREPHNDEELKYDVIHVNKY